MLIPEHILITKPETTRGEIPDIISMFEAGLVALHLRKPGITKTELLHFLQNIPEEYHCRTVVHQHYEVTAQFGLKGIHLPERFRESRGKDLKEFLSEYREKKLSVSTSFHAVPDIKSYRKYTFDYAFLSPVFDSISKKGYQGQLFDLSGEKLPFPVIALGGVTPRHISRLKNMGFSGAASLGYVWNSKNPTETFIEFKDQSSRFKV